MKSLDCPVCDLPMIQGIDAKKRPYAFCPPCGARFFVGRMEAVKKYEAKYGTAYKGDVGGEAGAVEPAPAPAEPKAKPSKETKSTPAPAPAAAPAPTSKQEPTSGKRRVTFFD